jgi:molybdopterin converting factor small subunit
MPAVKIPPVLRPHVKGMSVVQIEGGTVGDVLEALAAQYPHITDQIFAPGNQLNRYVNVYLNDEDVRVLDGLQTHVGTEDTVVILPAMAGGASGVARLS